jgi:hypothetical protein
MPLSAFNAWRRDAEAAKSSTPTEAVAEVKLTPVPFEAPVDQPVNVPEKVPLADERLALEVPAGKLEKAAAT